MSTVQPPTHPCRRLTRARRPLLLAALLLAATRAAAAAPAPDFYDPDTVRVLRLDFADADWESRLPTLPEGQHLLADLDFEGEALSGVGVGLKGNSSSRAPGRKKPLNLTIDATVKGQRLMGYDVVNLNNGFADPSFVRETLVSGLLRPFLPMPRAGYVHLDIGGGYWGAFTSIQQIEGTFIKQWFPSSDGILFKGDPPGMAVVTVAGGAGRGASGAGGWLGAGGAGLEGRGSGERQGPGGARRPEVGRGVWEAEPEQRPGPGGGFRATLRWLGADLAPYRQAYELKTVAAGDEGYGLLRDFIRVLDAPVAEGGVSDVQFPAAIQEVLDVDGALWYLAAINLFTNYDSYYAGHNFFLYRSPEDGRFHILLWDVNESFGVFPGAGISPADSLAVAHTDPFLMASGQQAAERPLIRRLLAVPEFRADYLAHMRTLLDGAFQPAEVERRVAALQDVVRADLAEDPNRIYGMDLFAANAVEDVNALGRAVPGILKVTRLRDEWLRARPDLQPPDHGLAAVSFAPPAPAAGQPIEVTVRFSGADRPAGVSLLVRVNHAAPQVLAMVAAADGAGWTATLPGQAAGAFIAMYARAAFSDGRSAFYPAANLTEPWHLTVGGPALPPLDGPLALNELLADNVAGDRDQAGEREDWVELTNRGTEPVSLLGYHLSDDPLDPWLYALPDVVLPPGGFYRLWCDGDLDQGPDHAPFKLAKGGETVLLSTRDAAADQTTFEALDPDASWARVPDGNGEWRVCDSPSGMAANRCGGAGVPSATPTATAGVTVTASASATATATGTPGGAKAGRVLLPWLGR